MIDHVLSHDRGIGSLFIVRLSNCPGELSQLLQRGARSESGKPANEQSIAMTKTGLGFERGYESLYRRFQHVVAPGPRGLAHTVLAIQSHSHGQTDQEEKKRVQGIVPGVLIED